MMTHDEMIDVIMHHKNGGRVEYKSQYKAYWTEILEPRWDFFSSDYRPKPEPMAIYAEVSTINGQVLRTSTKPIFHENDNTTIKKFIEAP